MAIHIRRREFFVTLIGGTAAWPVAVAAQEGALPVVGFLHDGSFEPRVHLVAGFRQGLSEAGLIDGRDVVIEYRWAQDQFDRLPGMAADLVNRQVAVIATPGSTAAALAAKAATNTIPIVFSGCRPSQARPCRQPQSPRRQRHRRELLYQRVGAKAARTALGVNAWKY